MRSPLVSTLGSIMRAARRKKSCCTWSGEVATISTANLSYIQTSSGEDAEVKLVDQTVGQVLDEASKKYGDREALVSIHQGIRKNFTQVVDEATQLAAGFLSIGLQPQDRVAVWAVNIYEWYLTQMAAAKAGLVLVCLNPMYKELELEAGLNLVGSKGLVFFDECNGRKPYEDCLVSLFPELKGGSVNPGELKAEKVPTLRNLIVISKKTHKLCDVQAAGCRANLEAVTALNESLQPHLPVNIQFTSGTTNKAKAIVLTHHNVVNNSKATAVRFGYDKKHHKICLGVPFFHSFGNIVGSMVALHSGATCVLPSPTYSPSKNLEAVEKERCTTIYGTPTMWIDMLAAQKTQKYDVSSHEAGFLGAAPFPPDLCKQIKKGFGARHLQVGYGMTETSPISLVTRSTDVLDKHSNTVGFPLEHLELKVVSTEGDKRILPIGRAGELMVRGYSVMKGYWGAEEHTREAIDEKGWLSTGDLARMLPDGYFQIVGRCKDMIIRGGENIFPREIEDLIFQLEDVNEVHVCGVPDSRVGEEVCAWIQRRDQRLDEDSIKSFLRDKVAHIKIPKYVFFVTSFPCTASGKIQKFLMREESRKFIQGYKGPDECQFLFKA